MTITLLNAACSFLLVSFAATINAAPLEVKRQLTAPCDVGGLIDGGENLWIADGYYGKLFCIRKEDGQLLAFLPASDDTDQYSRSATAIATNILVTGNHVRGLEPAHLAYRRMPSGEVIHRIAAPLGRPFGLAFDGTHLWTNPGRGRLLKVDHNTGDIVSSHRVNVGEYGFSGMHCVGNRLVVVSRHPDAVTVLSLDKQKPVVLNSYEAPGSFTCVLVDEKSLWLGFDGSKDLYEVELPPELTKVAAERISVESELPTSLTDAKQIFEAAREGNVGLLTEILDRNPQLANQRTHLWTKETPIFSAILFEQAEAVELLIQRGADVNAVRSDGQTPVFGAVQSHEEEIVQMLIDAGANVNARDRDGKTPIHSCAYGSPRNECVTLLIKAGADINAKDKAGRSVVDYAKWNDDLVQHLEMLGASTEVSNEREWMAGLTIESQPDPRQRLLEILRDEEGREERLRIAAAFTLYRLGSPNEATLDTLSSLLETDSGMIQVALLRTIGSFGPSAQRLAPKVREFTDSSRCAVRMMASIALGLVASADAKSLEKSDSAEVHGRTLHVVHGLPGALSGNPGQPIPPRPATNVTVHLANASGVFTALSDEKGEYRLKVPAGTYAIAWSLETEPTADNFAQLFGRRCDELPGEPATVTLQVGMIEEINIPATEMYVD